MNFPTSVMHHSDNKSTYGFLLETYETETLKTIGIWCAFPEEALTFLPSPKSRTVLEQMEHQLHSEGHWMATMFGIDTGSLDPAEKTKAGYITKYRADAARRLEILRTKPDSWWRESVTFFDVRRPRSWIFVRRLNHSTHHRGQLIVYLRVLGLPVPSVYGPTADTSGKVIYEF
jgi:uncharacterized damage-inducible protein DinB